MKKVLAIVIVLAGLAVGFFVIPSFLADSPEEMLNKIQSGDEEAVTEKISSIAETSVIEYDYTNAAKLKDTEKVFKKLKIPFTSKKIVMMYDGKMKLGADVSQIKVAINKDSDNNIKDIEVTLPPVQINSNDVDRDTITFPVEKATILNKLSSEDYDDLETKAKKEIAKKVKKSSVMDNANVELQKSVRGFLEGLYGQEVKITFKEKE